MTFSVCRPRNLRDAVLSYGPKSVRRRGPGRVVLGSKPQLATTEKFVSWARERDCQRKLLRTIGETYRYEPNYVLDARQRLPLRSQWNDQRNSGQESAHHRPGLAVALDHRQEVRHGHHWPDLVRLSDRPSVGQSEDLRRAAVLDRKSTRL